MKRKILYASVLKPVNDVRSYEKIGKTLAASEKYEVNIMGFPAKNLEPTQNINWHALPDVKRGLVHRMGNLRRFWKIFIKVKPEILIIQSPELLLLIPFIKILFGTAIYYDVQEDYYKNLRYNRHHGALSSWALAIMLRLLEWATKPFVKGFVLAEHCYQQDLGFVKGKNRVLENKSILATAKSPVSLQKDRLTFLLSGTLSKDYGLNVALKFMKSLLELNNHNQFIIIGLCYSKTDQKRILQLQLTFPTQVNVRISPSPIPFQEIAHAMQEASVGLLPYPLNRATKDRFPTKIFDYATQGIPMLSTEGQAWNTWLQSHHAGLSTDWNPENASEVVSELLQGKFYPEGIPSDTQWNTIAPQLLSFLQA